MFASIRRAPRDEDPYVRIPHRTIRDPRLSWKARGLLAYLLSLPEEENLSVSAMLHESPSDGPTSLRAALRELVTAGYIGLAVPRNATNTKAHGRRYVLLQPPETGKNNEAGPQGDIGQAPVLQQSRPPRSGYIYVVQCEDLHKIGCTRNPRGRLQVLSVKSPYPLTLRILVTAEDMAATESTLHQRFAAKRVRGEWFSLTPEDIALIAQDYPTVDHHRLLVD